MHDHIVVTVCHSKWIDWVWDDDPTSETFGEEVEVYIDDPLYVVEVYTEKYGVVMYGEIGPRPDTKDIDYHLVSDLQELAELIPEYLFGEILYDFAESDF